MNFNNNIPDKSIDELLVCLKIDPTEVIKPPKTCLELVEQNDERSVLGTLGNFSLVIGKAKSKKSFFVGLALSATTKNGLIMNKFNGVLTEGKSDVLYFDTEQAKEHVQKAVKRICTITDTPVPHNLHTYGLRTLTPSERLQLIEKAIYSNDKVGFVVIDGVKDLVTSINDEEQATMITSKLLKWTEERNIHIVTVLHQNKGDNNARGHIGTELINKAETVLSVTKAPDNKNISIVEAQYCRDKEPEPFAFEINEFGIPEIVENWLPSSSKTNGAKAENQYKPYQIYSAFSDVFTNVKECGWGELKIQLKLSFLKVFKTKIGGNQIVEFITLAKNKEWIIQEVDRGKYKLGSFAE